MSKRDPFEEYRRRREIELIESRFKEKAAEQRKRIENLLESEEGDHGDLEEKVTKEMEDFLSVSTTTAERMLETIYDDDSDEPEEVRKEQIRQEIRTFFASIEDDEPAEAAPAAPDAAAEEKTIAPPPAAAAEPPPKPSVVERRPLGGAQSGAGKPVDLKAALERIRRHRKGGEGADQEPGPGDSGVEREPERAPKPTAGSGAAARPDSRLSILKSFDNAVRKVSDLFQKGIEPEDAEEPEPESEPSGEAENEPEEESDRETLSSEAFVREAPLIEEAPPAPSPAPSAADPAAAEGEEQPGSPAGVTNVFPSDPDEDRDIDDDVDAEEPPGWDLPVRPPPPGAWIVKKQKEEGEGGLAGSAGDTYLMKKLSQEVRRLNRVYLVLLEKGVVTREEVEGEGEAAPVRVDDTGGSEEPEADGDGDDDVSVEDYDEERYRPILTSEKDFSLTSLVKDVHRLKCLREVLVKKGVVTQKELAKAK